MEICRAELQHKEVWASRFQSAGKGQKGNVWCSDDGANLTFSIFIRHEDIPASRQFVISQAVSLGVCDYLSSKGVETSIKWPNDIYVGDCKICGILISNTVGGSLLKDTVAGIGINLNQVEFPDWIPNPISLKVIMGNNYVIENELPLLVQAIFDRYDNIGAAVETDYLHRLYLKDTTHIYTDTASGQSFEGTIRGVEKDGRLAVETAGGTVRYFAFKEIAY